MNVKCFLIEKVIPEQIIWSGHSGFPLYRRVDTGEEKPVNQFGVGSIWRLDYLESYPATCGTDGRSYAVQTPGGDWCIDTRASNCGSPCGTCGIIHREHEGAHHDYIDSNPLHKCWCRHGEAPNFTVNKVGNTCNAGGGSIDMGGRYHGFLINGELTNCPD